MLACVMIQNDRAVKGLLFLLLSRKSASSPDNYHRAGIATKLQRHLSTESYLPAKGATFPYANRRTNANPSEARSAQSYSQHLGINLENLLGMVFA